MTSTMLRKAFENSRQLRRRLALSKDHLGHADPQRAVMIDFGEAEVLEGHVAEACYGIVR